jgi:hypothetical protein
MNEKHEITVKRSVGNVDEDQALAVIDGVAERIPPETEYMNVFVQVYVKDIDSVTHRMAEFMASIEEPNQIYDVNIHCMTKTRLLAKLSSGEL